MEGKRLNTHLGGFALRTTKTILWWTESERCVKGKTTAMFYTRRLICTVIFRNIGTLQENGQKLIFKKIYYTINDSAIIPIIIFSLGNICGRNIDTPKGYLK